MESFPSDSCCGWQRAVKRKHNESWIGKSPLIWALEDSSGNANVALQDTSVVQELDDTQSPLQRYISQDGSNSNVVQRTLQRSISVDESRERRMQHVRAKRRALASEQQFLYDSPEVEAFTIENELFLLKEALELEKKSIEKLHKELEQERCASATAANEAMAMIARLQEEKAAALMEACQYRRVVEEREAHSREAIMLLKDALLCKEEDLLSLQEEIVAYRQRLSQIWSAGMVLENGQDNLSIGDYGKTLFIEDMKEEPQPEVQVSTYGRYISNYGDMIVQSGSLEEAQCSKWVQDAECFNRSLYLVTEDEQIDEHDYLNDIENGYIRRPSRGDCRDNAGNSDQIHLVQGIERESKEEHDLEESSQCGAQVQDKLEKTSIHQSQERNLETMSMEILARVKLLEERFENLGANPVPEFGINLSSRQHELISCTKSSSEEVFHTLAEDSSYRMRQTKFNTMSLQKDRQIEYLGMTTGGEATTENWRPVDLTRETEEVSHRWDSLHKDTVVDSSESIHDVYEVEFEANNPHADLMDDMENMTGLKHLDVFMVSSSPHSHGPHIKSDIEETLATQVRSLDVKDLKTTLDDENLWQLKTRLQALESERVFMKEAIESLRKENRELKLLQDIAQQLCELKGDVYKPGNMKGVPKAQLTLVSYFKGLLGIQSSGQSEAARLVCPLKKALESGSSKIKHGGLYELLDKSPKATCVTRTLKVRIPSDHFDRSGYHQI